MNYKPKLCLNCRTEFIPHYNTVGYCSDECRKEGTKWKLEAERAHRNAYHKIHGSRITKERRLNDPTSYAREKELQNKRNKELKGRVVSHYTNGLNACTRCGFNDIRALCLHHTNGDGKQHRDGATVSLYRQVEQEAYPHGLEVLCANCHAIEHTIKEQTREQWLFKAREYVRLSEGLKTD